MPRPKATQPKYYKSRGAYYCWWDGKQHLLARGPDGDKDTLDVAYREFGRLKDVSAASKASDDRAVETCLAIYLADLNRHKKATTYETRRRFILSFQDYIGKTINKTLTVRDLKPLLVNQWVEHNEKERKHKTGGYAIKWGSMSRVGAIATMKAALNHCRKMGIIESNPLTGMEIPRAKSRGKKALIADTEHEALMTYCARYNRPFAEVLLTMHDTACRPGEVYKLTAEHVSEQAGVLFFDLTEWKTQAEHKFRHIFLSTRLEALVRELMVKYPTGPLFRTRRGNAWSENTVMVNFQRYREKLKLSRHLTAYCYRHTFATKWLRAGKSIKQLAELMGNSVTTIEHHYSHLLADKQSMQAALRDFIG